VRTTIFTILFFASRCFAADSDSPVLITREYRVAPSFLTWIDPDKNPSGWHKQPKEWLVQSGVPFSAGPSSIYISESQKLIVRHTASYQAALKQLVGEWRNRGASKPPAAKLLQALRGLDAAYKQ